MSTEAKQSTKKKKKDAPKLLRGFKDTMPEDQKYWEFVLSAVYKAARDYGFSYIETPVLEESRLFERSVGETSDIVSKELFRFNLPTPEDSDEVGVEVALRPEGTASVMRAYLEHGMINQPQPVKVWYWMSMFRYERPQAGRYRQHNQFGFEILGDTTPLIDAQLIIMVYSLYRSLGLDVVIPINSMGDPDCRPGYLNALSEFLGTKSKLLCEDCRKRAKKNPLRVLDCKQETCHEAVADAPQILDFLCEPCKDHFVSVLEYLDELDVPYALSPHLARGLDYYTRTTFEVYIKKNDQEEGGKLHAIGGGGRYDGLAENIGGREVPGTGMAAGIERIILALKENNIPVPSIHKRDIFIAQLGNEAKRKALRLFEEMRGRGWSVAESFSKDGLSAQLERANKLGVQFTLILGQKEILDGTVIIRDMSSGIQEEVNYTKLFTELEKRLAQPTVAKVLLDEQNPEEQEADMEDAGEEETTHKSEPQLFEDHNHGKEVDTD